LVKNCAIRLQCRAIRDPPVLSGTHGFAMPHGLKSIEVRRRYFKDERANAAYQPSINRS
jgi:hypothetical protein